MFYNYFTIGLKSAAVSLLLIICGCAPVVVVDPDSMPAPLSDEDVLLEEYKVGVGDSLNISVWRNPDLSTQVVVLPDGNISVPLVGNVLAAGQTTQVLSVTIKEALGAFIRQPEVTISVVSASSANYLRRVRVTGAVNSPTSINFARGLTVLDLVLLSGGLSPFANGNRATLYRTQDGEVTVYPVLLEDILARGDLTTNYPLMPADVITVPEKSF